ncbi:hypothetical protein AC249_AIPGENE6166 [Exaiptasia diaphana]|nr:hypothetical protein AC249_AIPGENE6166 [Exaiptasia diaphana]
MASLTYRDDGKMVEVELCLLIKIPHLKSLLVDRKANKLKQSYLTASTTTPSDYYSVNAIKNKARKLAM